MMMWGWAQMHVCTTWIGEVGLGGVGEGLDADGEEVVGVVSLYN